MIHVIGDSHAYSFQGIPGVATYSCGPVTLKRVGYVEDKTVPAKVASLDLRPGDMVIFCFGEIDVRCFAKPWTERHKKSAKVLLGDWAHRYARALSMLTLNGARIAIAGVVPPSDGLRVKSYKWPVAGTDKERVAYSLALNEALSNECRERGWEYLDIYPLLAGEDGLLPAENRYGRVHVSDNRAIREMMVVRGLL